MKSHSKHYLLFFLFLLEDLTLPIFSLDFAPDIVDRNNPHISDLLVSHYVPNKISFVNSVQSVYNLVLKSLQPQKAFVLLLTYLSALKPKASKHGHVKLVLSVKTLFVHKPIINTVVSDRTDYHK